MQPGRTFQRGQCGTWWGGRGPVGILWSPETCRGVEQTQQHLEGNPALWLLSLPCLPSPGSSCGHVCCRFFCFSIPGAFFWNDREGRIQAFRMPLCGHCRVPWGRGQARRLVSACLALPIPTPHPGLENRIPCSGSLALWPLVWPSHSVMGLSP